MTQQLQDAITKIKAGDREAGRQLLAEVMKTDPLNFLDSFQRLKP